MDYNALENMTVHKLREEAKKFPDIKGTTGMKKDELIRLLADKLGIEPTEKKKPKKPKKAATPLDKNAIKKKLAQLREERSTARSSGDVKKTALLRRRMHTLKRRMRMIDKK